MRRLKSLNLALMIVFALAAALPASAAALELPENLPVSATTRTWKGTSEGAASFKAGETTVECESVQVEGTEEPGKPLGEVHIRFLKCTEAGITCTGEGNVAGEILSLGTWHLVFDRKSGGTFTELTTALLLLINNTHFKCSALVLVETSGEQLCLHLKANEKALTHSFHCVLEEPTKGKPKQTGEWCKKNVAGACIEPVVPKLAASINHATAIEAAELVLGNATYKEEIFADPASAAALELPENLPVSATTRTWKGTSEGAASFKAGETTVECESVQVEGTEEPGKPLGEVHIRFLKCTEAGITCTGEGDVAGEILSLGTWHLVFDRKSGGTFTELTTALLLLINNTHFKCSALVLVETSGEQLCLHLKANEKALTHSFHCVLEEPTKGKPKQTGEWCKKNVAGACIEPVVPKLAASINHATAIEAAELVLGNATYKEEIFADPASAAALELPENLPVSATTRTWKGTSEGAASFKAGETTVECESVQVEGTEEPGKPLGEVHIRFLKCTEAGITCTGEGDVAGEILSLGTWHLVFDRKSGGTFTELTTALLLLINNTHFKCSALVLVETSGEQLCLHLKANEKALTHSFHCVLEEPTKGKPKQTGEWCKKNVAGACIEPVVPKLAASINHATAIEAAELVLGNATYKEEIFADQ